MRLSRVYALVCERHTGAGLSLKAIMERDLPVPHREMIQSTWKSRLSVLPISLFKDQMDKEKSVEGPKSIEKHGEEGWHVLMPGTKLF